MMVYSVERENVKMNLLADMKVTVTYVNKLLINSIPH